ncbi:DUF998 domain-containing protein [Pseudoxanthomonas sangjuensis]
MKGFFVVVLRWAPWLAASLFAAAVVAFGAALDGYSQALHPVALLGAAGFPRALAFNALGFMLPGALAAFAAVALRASLPGTAAWPLRIGMQLLLLAALAFAAMGFLPLDTARLDGLTSRLHGSAWMLWCMASALGGLLLGFGWLRQGGPATWTFAAVAGVLLAAFFLSALVPPGVAQRLAFGIWWLWLAGLGWWAAQRRTGH